MIGLVLDTIILVGWIVFMATVVVFMVATNRRLAALEQSYEMRSGRNE